MSRQEAVSVDCVPVLVDCVPESVDCVLCLLTVCSSPTVFVCVCVCVCVCVRAYLCISVYVIV